MEGTEVPGDLKMLSEEQRKELSQRFAEILIAHEKKMAALRQNPALHEKHLQKMPFGPYKMKLRGVIPKPIYKKARTFVIKSLMEDLEDLIKKPKTDILSFLPVEAGQRCGHYLAQIGIHRDMIPSFFEGLARQGVLCPHPLGGWMLAPQQLKQAQGQVIELLEVKESNDGNQ